MPERKKKRRKRRVTVTVADYTTPEWVGVVEGMVAQFSAILGDWGPRLVYQRFEVRDCGAIPAPQVASRTAICSAHNDPPPFSGTCAIGKAHDLITLYDAAHTQARHRRQTVCHELMHALADVPDNYGSNPDSCVYGYLDHPGGADAALLAEHVRRRA
jgi:hypothetical protein